MGNVGAYLDYRFCLFFLVGGVVLMLLSLCSGFAGGREAFPMCLGSDIPRESAFPGKYRGCGCILHGKVPDTWK